MLSEPEIGGVVGRLAGIVAAKWMPVRLSMLTWR